MPLPTTGKDIQIQLLINAPAVSLPAAGTTVADNVSVQSFNVDHVVDTITTPHLGTLRPDEDVTPQGFAGNMVVSSRDPRIHAAMDAYYAAKEANLPWEWLIVRTISFRDGQGIRTETYLKVELSVSESNEPGRANQLSLNWRCPARRVT